MNQSAGVQSLEPKCSDTVRNSHGFIEVIDIKFEQGDKPGTTSIASLSGTYDWLLLAPSSN
jgi:hypothetical protein